MKADEWDEYGRECERQARESFERLPLKGNGPPKIEPKAILADVHKFLGRFVSYPSEHAHITHVLWIAHTHCMQAWESTPRLAALSPEPESGETRLLETTALLVPNPVEAINVSVAYLFRKVGGEDGPPTILFDEIDTVFGPKAKENEETRALLNAGHRRGAVAGRCVVRGKTVETEEIPAYCAVALAGSAGCPTQSYRGRSSFECAADTRAGPSNPIAIGFIPVRVINCAILWRVGPRGLPRLLPTLAQICLPGSKTARPTAGSRFLRLPMQSAGNGQSGHAKRLFRLFRLPGGPSQVLEFDCWPTAGPSLVKPISLFPLSS